MSLLFIIQSFILTLHPFFASMTLAQTADGVVETPFPSYGGALLKMVATLLVLIVAVLIVVWLLKKFNNGRGYFSKERPIRVIDRHPLSPKTVVYFIEIGGQKAVLIESQVTVTQLTAWKEAAPSTTSTRDDNGS